MNPMETTNPRISARVPLIWTERTQTPLETEFGWENVRILLDRGEKPSGDPVYRIKPSRVRAPADLAERMTSMTSEERGALMNAAWRSHSLWTPSDDAAEINDRDPRQVPVMLSPDGRWLVRASVARSPDGRAYRGGTGALTRRLSGPNAPLWWVARPGDVRGDLVEASTATELLRVLACDPQRWSSDSERGKNLIPLL